MTSNSDHDAFRDLDYNGFRRLATEPGLSKYNRIGFPDNYREGFEAAIFRDICAKLPMLSGPGRTVLDIGPGCSDLPHFLIDLCRSRGHTLILMDSAEMLARLPDEDFVRKVEGQFPSRAKAVHQQVPAGVDIILCYSVLHYVFVDHDLDAFAEAVIALLNSPGQVLLGDIPNVSKRKRFFCSEQGARYHRAFTGRDEDPSELANECEDGKINDASLLDLLANFRRSGADAYLVPQDDGLPLANRREDILVRKP